MIFFKSYVNDLNFQSQCNYVSRTMPASSWHFEPLEERSGYLLAQGIYENILFH